MKKITALVAALAIALSLTACGDSSNTSLIGKLIGQGANTNNSSSEKSKTKIDKNTNDVIGGMGSTETFTTAKTENSRTTKLADIVGPGVPGRTPAPDIEVDAVLADISQNDYKVLINDLKHCVDMFKSIDGDDESSFDNDIRLIRKDNVYNDIIYYYDTYYNNFDELFEDARNCFSESFISTNDLWDKMFNRDFPTFLSVDGKIVWLLYCPISRGSGKYDFDNAGVVSYSDTEAEVWVAISYREELCFNLHIFKMIRYDSYDSWKIDKGWSVNNGDIDNKWEIGFYY